MYVRVAWFDREDLKYNFGTWHNMQSKTPEEYQSLQKWVSEQNKLFPKTKYWLELKDVEDECPRNKEYYDLISVTTQEDTDWLSV